MERWMAIAITITSYDRPNTLQIHACLPFYYQQLHNSRFNTKYSRAQSLELHKYRCFHMGYM